MEAGRPYSRLLSRLERISVLSALDKQRIANLPFECVNHPADREVLRSGCSPSRCTLVLQGFLYGHKIVGGSRRQITSFFLPGDIADLPTLYLAKMDYGISALGQAVIAFVPHRVLKEVLDESPALALAFYRETLMQAAITREWVVNLGRREALARVAHIICELAWRLDRVGLARDLTFPIPWTQMDVADASGISNVHANRVIQELRLLRLVEWSSRRVKILDWPALVRLGDFNENYLQYEDGDEEVAEPAIGSRQANK